MSNLTIVIAYYNNKHFFDLLDMFPHYFSHSTNTMIYNKSENDLVVKDNFVQKRLPNIGREGETYLNHIIENYDNLSEYTLFIQDDTDDHIPDYETFIHFCNDFINQQKQFALYPCSWRKNGKVRRRTITDGICTLHTLPSHDSIKKSCEMHGICLPEKYATETCAFFICHKNIILKHNKEFYIKLREWLLSNYKNGFVLEHLWKLIF